nr:hypothetical protein [Tanacetum cinerariifolium]
MPPSTPPRHHLPLPPSTPLPDDTPLTTATTKVVAFGVVSAERGASVLVITPHRVRLAVENHKLGCLVVGVAARL